MIVLGIESTAHTLSIGICENGRILSNAIDTYIPGKEGMIPRVLADHHARVFGDVLKKSLHDAGISPGDVGLVAFSQGPGIGSPLSAGCAGAKYLALKLGVKIIGVNHCYAHAEIGKKMTGLNSPLVLYLSGGNSQILLEKGGFYEVLGETLDIGLGNLFDSFARSIGMKIAHGSALEKLAKGGGYIQLPYSVKGMNLVFSGLLTAAERAAEKHPKKDVAYSLMETAFAMSCEVTERALFLTGKRSLLACGGVAQNKRLQNMLKSMCREDKVKFGVSPDEYNRDNGAMIAYAGYVLSKKFRPAGPGEFMPVPDYRIDRMKEILGAG